MNYKREIKLTFLTVFLALIYSSTTAQSSYAGISIGYGIPTKSSDDINTSNVSNTFDTRMSEQVNTGYGGGLNLAAKFGFGLSQFIGIEVGLNYLLGESSTVRFKETSNAYTYGVTTTCSSNMLQISPSIVLSPNNTDAFVNPYTRLGITTGFSSITQTTEVEQANSGKEIMTSELNGGFALGVNAAIGANFKLSEKVFLFGEFNLLSLTYAPKRETVTEFSTDGINRLPELTTNQKESEFYEELTITFNESENEPAKRLAVNKDYSSLGLNIGIKLNLN